MDFFTVVEKAPPPVERTCFLCLRESLRSLGVKRSARRLFVGMKAGVFGNAYHGEDLLEVRCKAEGLDGLAVFAGGNHHLNDECDAARIEILHLRKIEEDAFGAVRQTLISAQYRSLRRAGDVALKAEHGNETARALHFIHLDLRAFSMHCVSPFELFACVMKMNNHARVASRSRRTDPLGLIDQGL